jgi:hypothetical protein
MTKIFGHDHEYFLDLITGTITIVIFDVEPIQFRRIKVIG